MPVGLTSPSRPAIACFASRGSFDKSNRRYSEACRWSRCLPAVHSWLCDFCQPPKKLAQRQRRGSTLSIHLLDCHLVRDIFRLHVELFFVNRLFTVCTKIAHNCAFRAKVLVSAHVAKADVALVFVVPGVILPRQMIKGLVVHRTHPNLLRYGCLLPIRLRNHIHQTSQFPLFNKADETSIFVFHIRTPSFLRRYPGQSRLGRCLTRNRPRCRRN